jgi:hypothetical protein
MSCLTISKDRGIRDISVSIMTGYLLDSQGLIAGIRKIAFVKENCA